MTAEADTPDERENVTDESPDWEELARRELARGIEENARFHLGESADRAVSGAVETGEDAKTALDSFRQGFVSHDCYLRARLEEMGELDRAAPREQVIREAFNIVELVLDEQYGVDDVDKRYQKLSSALVEYRSAAESESGDTEEPAALLENHE